MTKRVFQQYWRSPSYIYSKGVLSFGAVSSPALSLKATYLMCKETRH